MPRISLKRLEQLCRRVGTSIEAGISYERIWELEANHAPSYAQQTFQIVTDKIREGDSIANALRATNGYFPTMVCEMVDAGEHSGRLGDVFNQLADHCENLLSLRRTFLSGIWWPVFELVASIGIVGILILVLGMVSGGQGREAVDIFGLGLSPTGNFILYVMLVSIVSLGVAIPIIGVWQGWFGSAPIRIAQKIPLIGPTIECLSLSRMAWSLAMAIDAGMDAIQSLRLAIRATQNPLYVERVEDVEQRVREGQEMHVALQGTGVFPSDFLITLENGELTGQVTETMDRLSNEYRSKAETLFRSISAIGAVAVMALLGMILIAAIFFLFTRLVLNPINDLSTF